jgi:sRNA-binding protein
MATTMDMNIVLGQGNAIKEVHNARRQVLELNQQFVAQQTEEKKKEDKAKVQGFKTENRIEVKGDEEKKKNDSEDNEKDLKKGKTEEESDLSEGSIIDIKI